MTTTVEVSYSPQLGDVLHAARIAEGEMWQTASRVVAVLLLLGGVWLVYSGLVAWALPFVALAIAEWLNLLPMSVLAAYVQFKRNPKYRQRYHLVLSPEALSFRTETIKSELKWDIFSRLRETKRAFVLCYGSGVPTVIPKAAFSSAADIDSARTLLETVVGSARNAKRAAQQEDGAVEG